MERQRKGECSIQYVYKPYHGWRHGYRREKRKRWILRIAKVVLVVEGVILAWRYIEAHTYEQIYEREVFWTDEMSEEKIGTYGEKLNKGTEGDVFGIGFGAEDGSLFWFHRRMDTEEIKD